MAEMPHVVSRVRNSLVNVVAAEEHLSKSRHRLELLPSHNEGISAMYAKLAAAFAAIAIALSVVTLAPTASAAPETPAPTPAVGSVTFCFTIPLGVFAFSICI
ncbi:hypothetical protein [Nocardia sp. NPDC052112]|uniref:hypothetical protein n=1 Tax=Nocardia sp. NPDC052112 TaxID=3155646 RepID=UPI00344299C8